MTQTNRKFNIVIQRIENNKPVETKSIGVWKETDLDTLKSLIEKIVADLN